MKRESIQKKGTLAAAWLLFLGMTLASVAGAESGPKYVEIDKSTQTLRAYEGPRLVLECRVSTGRWDGATPNGMYRAGEKSLMHYSRLYHHAPMPYSIYLTGNVFIHGFKYVPAWPASHGCIRVPLDGLNPAKLLYEWIEPGTVVEVIGHWSGRKRLAHSF